MPVPAPSGVIAASQVDPSAKPAALDAVVNGDGVHAHTNGGAAVRANVANELKRTSSLQRLSTLDLFSLADKALIVTGGGRGLGLMIATSALEAKCPHVYCLDISTAPDQAEWAVAQNTASKYGSKIEYHRIDITQEAAVDALIASLYAKAEHPIGGYFGSAGMIQQIPALEYPADGFRRVLDVNTTGSFLTMRATAREMVKRGIKGSIVLVASMSGSITNKGLTSVAYNTSKAACLQLVRSCAAEWGTHGIRVNSLSPGYIRTALTDQLLAQRPDLAAEWLSTSMLERLSTPDEFRGPAVYLLSKASSFMTGSDLRVDGGHTAY